jgi:hypothetical protein
MPSWSQVLKEIENDQTQARTCLDVIRRKYLRKLHSHTGRNVIAYYSGWLQKGQKQGYWIDDVDKNAFMTTIHSLDRSKGLDLLLHTPGGSVGATESIVDYLHLMFKNDMRVIVPQLAMSAGTMIACASKEIVMGKQSNLGPIDPQYNGIPAEGVVEEFERAKQEVAKDPKTIPIWQLILSKYHPTFIGECRNAIQWSKEIVTGWLASGMFSREPDPNGKAKFAVEKLSDHEKKKSHDRHIHIDECREIGLKIFELETDDTLQDLVLTVHHAYMHTFGGSPAIKIVENHKGIAMVTSVPQGA